MNLDQAQESIRLCAEQMRARYNDKDVFDEWALIAFEKQRGRILAYTGPRKDGFKRNFASDMNALRNGLLKKEQTIGDFEFTRDAVGTSFESYMVAGDGVYLICNNTVQSMDTIARDPLWLHAQVPFVELSERFRVNPVVQ